MKAEDIVSVQSLVGFSQWLEHESIVRITGSWETDKAIFIVEEFAALGDLMQVRGILSEEAGVRPPCAAFGRHGGAPVRSSRQ